MLLQKFVLVILVQYKLQTKLTLSPAFNDVLENSTLELTCHVSESSTSIKWRFSDNNSRFSLLEFSKDGFLNEAQYFDTECYRNVPIKYVKFKRIYENVLKTVEMNKTTITCETSEGRPVANITWRKISNEGIIEDVTNEAVYNVSRQETVTEKNMTIVTSSIAIIPVKEDNNSRTICEATNIKSHVVKKEITMYVQYPPSRPVAAPDFYFETNISSAQNETITFHFKAVAYPTPEFHWFIWSGSSWKILKNDIKNTIIDYDNNSSLSINAITEEDYRHYRLLIRNSVGSLEQLYFLNANEKPDQPKMFECLNEYVTETSTILRWTPGFDGGPDQTFILRYKLNKDSKWKNVSIPDDGGKTMNYTIGELHSGSVYYTELFAVNSVGKSNTLNLTFKTKDKPTLTDDWWIYVICVICGILMMAAIPVAWYFRKRREWNGKQPTEVVIANQTTTSNDEHIVVYENINVYEHLNEEFKERDTYMELQPIETNDSHKDYLTPI